MASNVFFSQNKSSSSERDSLTPCNMHLTPCNMIINIARLLQCKVNGDRFMYIIKTNRYEGDHLIWENLPSPVIFKKGKPLLCLSVCFLE